MGAGRYSKHSSGGTEGRESSLLSLGSGVSDLDQMVRVAQGHLRHEL